MNPQRFHGAVKAAQDLLVKMPAVRSAILFGSTARGSATEDSDIDLFIECNAEREEEVARALYGIEGVFNVPARLSFAKKTGVDSISSFSSRFSGRARKPANRVSNPRRTEAPDFREVGIVRDNATPETKRRGGNHAVRHGEIPMLALQEPGLARQLRLEVHHLQASVLKGPELG